MARRSCRVNVSHNILIAVILVTVILVTVILVAVILVAVILVAVLMPRGLRRGRALRGSRFIVIDFFN